MRAAVSFRDTLLLRQGKGEVLVGVASANAADEPQKSRAPTAGLSFTPANQERLLELAFVLCSWVVLRP